jgi:hypothetical protein
MRKLLVPIMLILAVFFVSCSKDDDGGTTPPPAPKVERVVVDTLAVAPLLTSVDEATWTNVDSCLVTIGGSPTLYGRDAVLGEQEMTVKAIKKSDTLYMLVRWHDYVAHVWADNFSKINGQECWEHVTSAGQDIFEINLYAPDTSSDSGSYDIWAWMATTTAPGRMAEDRWKTTLDSIIDPTINYYVYKVNPFETGACNLPALMPKDSTDFIGPYMYKEDTVDYDATISWPDGSKIPGYFIDTTIFNLATRNLYSRWDVKAISNFDSLQASVSDYTWTVVFARALNTQHNEDVDLSGLDSVKISFIADNKYDPTAISNDYSGSAPFWLILKP